VEGWCGSGNGGRSSGICSDVSDLGVSRGPNSMRGEFCVILLLMRLWSFQSSAVKKSIGIHE
jgi:hypothetical protein